MSGTVLEKSLADAIPHHFHLPVARPTSGRKCNRWSAFGNF
jgi:hypothetical protein